MLLRQIILGLIYLVSSILASHLSVPPGYAVAIWPPAGAALAGTIFWGKKMLPSIGIYAFLFNLWIGYDNTNKIDLITFVPSFFAAFGSILQSIFGAFLFHRFIGTRNHLDTIKDVFLLLFLNGPITCLVSASIGVSSLWIAGSISSEAYFFSWFNWWIGDSLGILLLLPIFFVWAAKTEKYWKQRRWYFTIPMGIVFTMVITTFLFLNREESIRIKREFDREAAIVDRFIQIQLKNHIEYLDYFSKVGHNIDDLFFKKFIESYPFHKNGILAIEWAPLVDDKDREVYENKMKKSNLTNYEIKELDSNRRLQKAAKREEYFPIQYVKPLSGNEIVLGYDIYSEPIRKQTVNNAILTEKIIASPRLKIIQELEDSYSVIFFKVIFDNPNSSLDTLEKRKKNAKGLVLSIIRMKDLVNYATEPIGSDQILISIEDMYASDEDKLLYSNGILPEKIFAIHKNNLFKKSKINTGERVWLVSYFPSESFLSEKRTILSLGVLFGGLFLTALTGGFLLIATGRARRIELLVKERTQELNESNERLIKEITERKQAEFILNSTLNEIQKDLSTARKIQQNMLPSNLRLIEELEILPVYLPIAGVGGDIYCVDRIADNQVRIFIADASGHGLHAALITMAIKGIYDNIRSFYSLSPADLLEIFNNEFLHKYISLNRLLTAILVDIDISKQELSYASAGHTAGVILHSNKTIELLPKTGKIIGIQSDVRYFCKKIAFQKGDRLFLFTDGLFEEYNSAEEEFSEERIHSIILDNYPSSLQSIITTLLSELEIFLNGKEKQDDITLLGIDYK